MRGLTLMRGLPISQIKSSRAGEVGYLLTPDPKEIWIANDSGDTTITVDLGSPQPVDTVFLGFTNLPAGATFILDTTETYSGGALVRRAGPAPIRIEGGADGRFHGLIRWPAPITERYWWLRLYGLTEPLQAGALMFGARLEQPYEFKSGRRLIDLSDRVELAGGGFGFGEGAVKSSFKATVADLADDELAKLFSIAKSGGNRSPVLAIEGGDSAIDHDQVHYGVFDRFEAYERENPRDTRWSLSVQDWI